MQLPFFAGQDSSGPHIIQIPPSFPCLRHLSQQQFLSPFHHLEANKDLDPQLLQISLTLQHFQYVLRRRRQQLRSTSMPCLLVDQWGVTDKCSKSSGRQQGGGYGGGGESYGVST